MTATAFMLIGCDLGKEQHVIDRLVRLSPANVKMVRATYGIYDVLVRIDADTMQEVNAVVVMIRQLPDMHSTITLPVVPELGGLG